MEVNDAFCALTGRTREEIVGAALALDAWLEDAAGGPGREALLAGPGGERLEGRLRARDGRVVPVLLSTEVVGAGETEHLLVSVRDATERRRAEAEILQHRRQIETVGEIQRELLGELRLDQLLQRMVERAGRLFEAQAGIYAWDGGDWLVPMVDTVPARWPLRLGEGLSGRCALTRRGELVNHYASWPHALPRAVEEGLGHIMVQPLVVGEELLGRSSSAAPATGPGPSPPRTWPRWDASPTSRPWPCATPGSTRRPSGGAGTPRSWPAPPARASSATASSPRTPPTSSPSSTSTSGPST